MRCKQFSIIVVIFILSLVLVQNLNAQAAFKMTPSDAEGPFYPTERQSDEDNDLLNVKGKPESAKGDVLNLTGIAINKDGDPQSDVIIEIWQTDVNGLYNHPRDWSRGARDPFFQYWGRAKTDKEGKYSFKTILPGEYEPRPPHIHFKVWVDDEVVLTSQMYIAKGKNSASNINELLRLNVSKNNHGEYVGFFRIVY